MSRAASLWLPLRHSLRCLALRCLAAVIGVCAAIAAATSGAVAAPSDIAIIITNSTYDDSSIPAVKYAEKDGASMASAMTQVFGVTRDNVHQVQNATYGRLLSLFGPEGRPEKGEVFKWVQQNAKNNRKMRLYVYYSGHGSPHVRDDGTGTDAYLVTKDAILDNLPVTAYALKTLRGNLATIKSLVPDGEVVLILEACFSGRTGNDEPLRPNTSQVGVTFDFGGAPGEIIELDAAQNSQAAFWDEKTQHGVFTDQLLWGIYGLADNQEFGGNGDGQVTLGELDAFLKKRIPDRLKVNKRNGVQTAAIFGAVDLSLTASGRQRRPDMMALEREEEANCGALEKAENENYTRLSVNIASIRKFLDEDCRLCECRGKLEARQRYLEEKQQVCINVANQIQNQKDAGVLRYYAEQNQCAQLNGALLRQAKILQDVQDKQVCAEDQSRWNEVKKKESTAAMDLAIDQMSCASVRDGARAEIQRRKGFEATITDMKSAAVDLGQLTDGQTIERKSSVGGDNSVGFWKFQIAANDTVGIHLDDLTVNLDVDLRDASYEIIARPRQGGPRLKEIDTADKLKPGTYYIRIAPADGKRGSTYTLRVAKGAVDTAGESLATARDLGALGPGTAAIHEHVGGIDRGDVFKFTAQERMRLQLTVSDMSSDVHLDLLNQNGQTVQSSHNHGRQHVEWIVEARATYYIAVKPAGEMTAYSLGIGLSPFAPFSRAEMAAQAAIGTTLTHTLTPSADEYWAQFPVRDSSTVSIDLTWGDPQTELELDLYKDETARRPLIKRVVAQNTTSHKITEAFNPGTYLIRVKRNAGSSPATEIKVNLRSVAANSGKEAAIVPMIGAEPVNYTLPANEIEHWRRFSVTAPSKVKAVLNWNDAAVDLDMELKDERGNMVGRSAGTITTEQVEPFLQPGTYLVRIFRQLPTSMAAVPFRLTLTWTPQPGPKPGLPPRTTPGR
jgi:hypothetical protein